MMPPEFHFLRPWWLLLLLPLTVLLWRLLRSRDQAEAWRDLVDPHLLNHLLVDAGGRMRRQPMLLLGLGWLLLVLAVAGPTWQRLPQPVFQAQEYRVIVLDLSPSMNTPDRPPSRLTQARFEVLDMLRRWQEGQTAMIAFGAEPYVVSPLTSDVETIALQVPSLETELLPLEGPQRVDLALQEAGLLLQQASAPEGLIILVTDKLTAPAAAIETASALTQRQYRVSVLGMGNSDEQPLRKLALAGNGIYVSARAGEQDLDVLLADQDRSGLQGNARKDDASTDQWQEEGPWLLLALIPLAALAFRRGWLSPLLLVILVTPPTPGYALSWAELWQTPDQLGLQKLQEGQAEQAAEIFERQDWRAAAHYAAGDYAQALETLSALEQATAYNRGNALAHLGRLREALAAYDEALKLNPDDADALHNRDLVARLLEQQRNEPQREQEQPDMSASGSGGEPEPDSSQSSSGDQSEDAEQQDDETQQTGDAGSAQQSSSRETTEAQAEAGSNDEGEQSDSAQQKQSPQSAAGGENEEPPAETENGEMSEQPLEQAAEGEQPTDAQRDASGPPQELRDEQAQTGESPTPEEQTAEGPSGDPGLEDLLGGSSDMLQQQAYRPSQQSDPESEQAVQQMLRMVEDDPTGLLRQRFLLQHLRRQGRLP